jgi:Tol biopolymer transport system component
MNDSSYHAPMPWRHIVPRATRISLASIVLVGLLLLTGCNLLPAPSNSAVITQGHGLPSLRHLDWGFAAFHHPTWSPDGHWIAVLAGDDFAGAHVEVVSPDGQTRYDLSSWGCGEGPDPDFAWLPDGRLSCISRDTPYPQMCIGAAPFNSCTATHLTDALSGGQWGITWTPNGRSVLYPAQPNDGTVPYPNLYVLAPDGSVRQVLLFSDHYGAASPSFRPHAAELGFYRGASLSIGGDLIFDLVVAPVSQDATGRLILGSSRTIATEQLPGSSGFAWSPSGRWLAVNHADFHGGDQSGDKISLINPDNPKQIIDVVQADLISLSMNDPCWSPDGKTLIVFGGNGGPQPYAIDIASYLANKGIQP